MSKDIKEYKYYAGGEYKSSNERIEVFNPASGVSFSSFYEAHKEDLEFAIEKAKDAQEVWRTMGFKERAAALRQISGVITDNLSLLSELETKEIGKPLKESLFVDVPMAAQCFDYYACFLETLEEEHIRTDSGIDSVKYEPFGVAGIYLPYNVPLMIFGFSAAAALAAGNALIIKPSEYGSLSILELIKYIDRLDIPKGLISVLPGKG